ncbi:DUF1403 family protein [Tabrizicola sp. KVB23]|uniref:DUF1403 family protein n=2 Tax=Fuscibacter oryzae TaxID=2803939 RepID=A0A8J7MQN2_9RHOB|nr:DUF1403 family protein [Fuscibacter oryzae]
MPGWITSARAETPEDVAFLSGAALAHLHLVAQSEELPHALWRDRLALRAAELCVGLSGRRETAAQLRDALHLTRPGDDPGPAGGILRQWSRAVARPISVAQLGKVLEGVSPELIALCLEAKGVTPIARAAAVMEIVLSDAPRAETTALILADAALAQATGSEHLVPLLSLAMKPRDLARRGEDLRLACHRAVVAGVGEAIRLAADLAKQARRFRTVTPRLRARGADQAVDLFLSRDALAPATLNSLMSDRAARRLCDRLVELGVVRELTGRDSFRLFGL